MKKLKYLLTYILGVITNEAVFAILSLIVAIAVIVVSAIMLKNRW